MAQQEVTWQKHDRVKVIKTGELGNVAYLNSGSKKFYMNTFAGGMNTNAVIVHMDGTGEFRTYALSALENTEGTN